MIGNRDFNERVHEFRHPIRRWRTQGEAEAHARKCRRADLDRRNVYDVVMSPRCDYSIVIITDGRDFTWITS